MFEAHEALYLDAEGRATADETRAVSLLVCAGGQLPIAEAERHGVLVPTGQPTHKAIFMGRLAHPFAALAVDNKRITPKK